MYKYTAIILLVFLLTACGSKTTVILLPEDGGKNAGAVVVQTKEASQIVDTPYTETTVSAVSAKPSAPKPISKDQVARQFQAVLDAQPLKPISYTLYFVTGSTKLTKASTDQIPTILDEAEKRAPSEISIIGHTDSTGSKQYNLKLSLERATAVEKLLKDAGADMKKVYISYHGESDPLIPTKDNVAEPRNRRVEIMIR